MLRSPSPLARCITLALAGCTGLASAATVTVNSATTTGQVLSGETTLQVAAAAASPPAARAWS